MGEGSEEEVLSCWSLELVEPIPKIFEEITESYDTDRDTHQILQEVQNNPTTLPDYSINSGVLLFKGRLVIPNNLGIKQ